MLNMKIKIVPILIILFTIELIGCSTFLSEEERTKNWSAKRFYSEAKESLDSGNYKSAIDMYEKLEARYPFGKYATQSQLDVAYAYYKYAEPESALAAANRFLRLHPNSKQAPYALYLKGLVNFNRSLGFLSRFIPTDSTQRDPGASQDSFKDFSELVRRYPRSDYAKDAHKRLLYLRNNIAQSEVNIAQFYLKKKAYIAAVRRASKVIEHYQKTPAVKPALEVMIKAYDKMGLKSLAEDSRRILTLNQNNGAFISEDTRKKPLGYRIWDALELDKN